METCTPTKKGRKPHKVDWARVRFLFEQGASIQDVQHDLKISYNTLNRQCRQYLSQSINDYRKLIRKQKVSPKPFSPDEVKQLLRSYYSGALAKSDRMDRLPRLKAKKVKISLSHSTGISLTASVTYPQLDAILTELRSPIRLDGITVRDGYEYVLRCWINPQKQSEKLPQLFIKNPNKNYWDATDLGSETLKKALIAFHSLFYSRVINKKDIFDVKGKY